MRDGHASQLAALAFGDQGISGLGLGQSGFFVDRDKSTQVLVLFGAGQKVLGGFGSGDLLGAQLRGQLSHAQLVEFGLAHCSLLFARLLDDLGHEEITLLGRRGVLHVGVAVIGLTYQIVT